MSDSQRWTEGDPPSDEIERWADDIVSRTEFRPRPRSLLEQAVDGVQNAIEWVLSQLAGGGAAGAVGTLVAWLLLATLVGAVAFGVWSVARNSKAERGRKAGPQPSVSFGRRDLSVDDWTGRARQAELDGDLDEAVRCWWRAGVAGLDAEGALEERTSGTVGEYEALVASRASGRSADLEAAGRRFESVWYGGHGADDDDVAAIRERSGRLARQP
jgi:hypothetical protein